MVGHYHIGPEVKVVFSFYPAYGAYEDITVFRIGEEWLIVVAGEGQLMDVAWDIKTFAGFVFHLVLHCLLLHA